MAQGDLATVPDFFRVGYAGASQFIPTTTQPAPILSLLPEGLVTPISLKATTAGDPVTGLDDEAAVPVFQVYPNPAYDRATVEIHLSEPQTITLTAYTLRGVALSTIARGPYAAGTHFFSLAELVKNLPNQLLLIRLERTDDGQSEVFRSVRLLTH